MGYLCLPLTAILPPPENREMLDAPLSPPFCHPFWLLSRAVRPFCPLLHHWGFSVACGGHLINKLQVGITLLIFKIWKIWDVRLVGNLILNTSCKFRYDDKSPAVHQRQSLRNQQTVVKGFCGTDFVEQVNYESTVKKMMNSDKRSRQWVM